VSSLSLSLSLSISLARMLQIRTSSTHSPSAEVLRSCVYLGVCLHVGVFTCMRLYVCVTKRTLSRASRYVSLTLKHVRFQTCM